MQGSSKRAAHRAIGAAIVLAGSVGLAGCAVPPGTNLADLYQDYAGFCGILQDCGSDRDTNRGGNQTAVGESSDDSTGGSTGGSGSSATAPNGGN